MKLGESKLLRWVRLVAAGARSRWFSLHFMNLAGLFAAGLIFVCANVLVSRFYQRWDLSRGSLYTLSPVTEETLSRLQEPIEIVVFLSQGDPLTASVRHMLDAYGAKTTALRTRFVDPDRNPAEFVALQREYGIFEGKTENGRLASEASLVVVRGERRWYVTTDDIVVYDDESGSARPQLEQVLTEGIVNVLGRDEVRVCFTSGHGELDPAAGGPQSLSELRKKLEQNNYKVSEVDLSSPDPTQRLQGCRVVVVAGPTLPFSEPAAQRLRDAVTTGASLLLAVGPVVDDEGRILDPGLRSIEQLISVKFARSVVFEQDDALRMPIGLGGEVFLTSAKPHPVTRGLNPGAEERMRVVLQLAQGLSLDPNSTAAALLVSSPKSLELNSFKVLASGEFLDGGATQRSTVLATASELTSVDSGPKPRVLVLGSASPLWASTFSEPVLLGTRRFVESAFSWLAAQPQLVSVPQKPPHPAGLHLTEESLSEVQRYVLIYMPVTVALVGFLVLYRRRREDQPEDRA